VKFLLSGSVRLGSTRPGKVRLTALGDVTDGGGVGGGGRGGAVTRSLRIGTDTGSHNPDTSTQD
jgi:hypothetical protein